MNKIDQFMWCAEQADCSLVAHNSSHYQQLIGLLTLTNWKYHAFIQTQPDMLLSCWSLATVSFILHCRESEQLLLKNGRWSYVGILNTIFTESKFYRNSRSALTNYMLPFGPFFLLTVTYQMLSNFNDSNTSSWTRTNDFLALRT